MIEPNFSQRIERLQSNVKAQLLFCLMLIFSCLQVNAQWNPENKNLWQFGRLDSIYSKALGEQRHFWVHLPNNYELDEGRSYPVVYILDGSLHLSSYVNYESYYTGKIPEMIVVAISNRRNRTRDLTPTNIDKKDDTPRWARGGGGGENFTQFLKEELIPQIEDEYPTTSYRTLIGHSLAGLFAINTYLKHSDLFKNYVAIDPSLWWDDELMFQSLQKADKGSLIENRLFISVANNTATMSKEMSIEEIKRDTTIFTEGMRANLKFVDKVITFSENKFGWKYYKDETHQSVPLLSINDGINFLFDWYAFDGDALDLIRNPNSDPIKSVEAIKDHYKKLSENFGYQMLPEEDMMNNAGYMFMEASPQKAFQFFKLNVENYPKSANVYDSMADYYIAQKDIEEAILYLNKAFEVSGNAEYKTKALKLKTKE